MAVKKHLEQYDKNGTQVPIYLNADEVNVGNQTLEEKLEDIEGEIEEAGEYTPPQGGIPADDLAGGIPKSKLDDNVKSSLDKADSAVQGVIFNGTEVAKDPTTKKVTFEQVQPNWDETNQNSKGFIANKPSNVVTNVFYEQSTRKFWKNSSNGGVQEIMTLPEPSVQVQIDDQLANTDNLVKNRAVKAAIDSLQNSLNTLIGSGNVQGAIDTFNEITAFLNGINTTDPTLRNQLLALDNAITALQTTLSSKANAADVNTALSQKQDKLTFDDEPTAGHTTQVMSSDKIKTAIDQVTPTIDVNGKWVIGGVATDKDAQGPRGNTVLVNENAQGIQALIVNNASDGGETDILSAEMGKVLRQNIMRIFNALGTYAFPEGKPTLNWGSTVINHSINVNGVTGGLTIADVEIDGVSAASLPAQIVEGKSLSLRLVLPSDLYVFNDGVSITMGGVNITTQQGVWDESTGEINIAEVTGDIVISANAITYVGYGEQNSPLVLMFDGKNQGSTANQWENLCDTNKPLVLSGGYTKSSDHVAFDGIDGNGVIDQLNINMPYKTTSVETVFSSASMPPASNSIMIINNFAENTMMAFGTGSGIYANRIVLYACTKYYQEEIGSGYTSPFLDTGAGNYMFSANQVVSLCRYGQQFSLNNNTLVNATGDGLKMNIGKDSSVLGDFSVSGFISRLGTYFGPFNGSLYCVRVYSRILTDNEKAQNYKVDQKRFNLS